MKKYRYAIALAFLPALFLLQGCFISYEPGDPPPPAVTGSIDVEWLFEGAAACPVDVGDVVIRLSYPDGSTALPDIRVPCTAGGRLVRDVPAGQYEIKLLGLDFEQVSWESAPRLLQVYSGTETRATLNLYPL